MWSGSPPVHVQVHDKLSVETTDIDMIVTRDEVMGHSLEYDYDSLTYYTCWRRGRFTIDDEGCW